MNRSPADILANHFILEGIGWKPETIPSHSSGLWPVYINFEPPEGNLAIVVNDTAAKTDGREMRTGVTPIHPGIQLMFRALDPSVCYDKSWDVFKHMSKLSNVMVSTADSVYTIKNACQLRPPLKVGIIEGKDWMVYTVNFLLTISELNQA